METSKYLFIDPLLSGGLYYDDFTSDKEAIESFTRRAISSHNGVRYSLCKFWDEPSEIAFHVYRQDNKTVEYSTGSSAVFIIHKLSDISAK